MSNLLAVLALGFFLGMRHATDADHVVAVTTIVSRERTMKTAALLGGLWGIGHTITILLVGGAIIAFGVVVPARLGLTMELSVAVMLVLLGGLNLAGFSRDVGQLRPHRHGLGHHDHDGVHGPAGSPAAAASGWIARLGSLQAVRSLAVGVVHGLAGSAAVALMVLATIRSVGTALLYLLLFGAGTIAGMMLITSAIALPMAFTASRCSRWNRHLAWLSGLLSVGFGLFLVYEIGFVNGLFTGNPTWDPR